MNTITKVSDITTADVAEYLRIDDAGETTTLSNMITAAKAYIAGYTGLTAAEIDTHADFVIAVFVLCQDMYDNRAMYVDTTNVNKVVETILGMHAENLL